METKHASRVMQTKIYTGKCFRVFLNDRGWKIFISAVIITLIITSVTSSEMFKAYRETRNGAFALVCACIWIGIFNSIQSVCRERDIIKREHRSGLHISSYVVAHMFFEMFLCFVEGIIVTAVLCIANAGRLPDTGVLLAAIPELAITLFLTIFSADMLGLMVSCMVKTPNTAMTVMPFILILQLVMSGMIFELTGITEQIAKLTISKWSMNAICITSNINAMPLLEQIINSEYQYSVENIVRMWLILAVFVVLYGVIAIISLKLVDYDKR